MGDVIEGILAGPASNTDSYSPDWIIQRVSFALYDRFRRLLLSHWRNSFNGRMIVVWAVRLYSEGHNLGLWHVAAWC